MVFIKLRVLAVPFQRVRDTLTGKKSTPREHFTQAFTLFRIEKSIFVIHQKNDDYGNNGPLYSI